MTDAERWERSIQSLPGSLHEAILECEKSELVRKTIGGHIFHQLKVVGKGFHFPFLWERIKVMGSGAKRLIF